MKLIINKKYKDYFLLLSALIFLFINYYLKPKKIKIENKFRAKIKNKKRRSRFLWKNY